MMYRKGFPFAIFFSIHCLMSKKKMIIFFHKYIVTETNPRAGKALSMTYINGTSILKEKIYM